jgi:PPM family protein phosphatase
MLKYRKRNETMRSAALTDIGLVRARNEDAFWCDAERGIFMIADGIGVSQGGEVAAGLAVEVVSTELTLAVDRGLPESQLADAMYDAFKEAAADIFSRAQQSEETKDMACSAIAAILLRDQCLIAHAGDVRAYLFTDEALHQITTDDTPVAVMVKRGYMLPEKAKSHHLKNVLVKSIGSTESVDANLLRFPVKPKERLLFCSDGLWGTVPNSRIREIFSKKLDPEETCRELIYAARDGGGQDNITVVVVEMDRPTDQVTGGRRREISRTVSE